MDVWVSELVYPANGQVGTVMNPTMNTLVQHPVLSMMSMGGARALLMGPELYVCMHCVACVMVLLWQCDAFVYCVDQSDEEAGQVVIVRSTLDTDHDKVSHSISQSPSRQSTG